MVRMSQVVPRYITCLPSMHAVHACNVLCAFQARSSHAVLLLLQHAHPEFHKALPKSIDAVTARLCSAVRRTTVHKLNGPLSYKALLS